jgi:hypothetical protein
VQRLWRTGDARCTARAGGHPCLPHLAGTLALSLGCSSTSTPPICRHSPLTTPLPCRPPPADAGGGFNVTAVTKCLGVQGSIAASPPVQLQACNEDDDGQMWTYQSYTRMNPHHAAAPRFKLANPLPCFGVVTNSQIWDPPELHLYQPTLAPRFGKFGEPPGQPPPCPAGATRSSKCVRK